MHRKVLADILHCLTKLKAWYFLKMSLRRFSILGDSNIKRHMNPTNCRDRPLMSGAQVIPCGKAALLAEAMRSVRKETNVVLLSCITNFLTSSEEAGSSLSFRVMPVLQEVFQIVVEASQSSEDRFIIVAPPMYRHSPLWYRDGLPEILTKFSEVFKQRPKNVLMMSSFPTPEFESDGIHLNPYSGLEFVLHLFDSSNSLLDSVSQPSSETAEATTEATRLLQDRMVAIEQDHRRLVKVVDTKSAEDAELADFNENIRLESSFMITGLKSLGEGLSPKDWQTMAIRDVQAILTILLGEERPIKFIQNKTSRNRGSKDQKDPIIRYMVEMRKTEDSKEIRDKFGSFFIGVAAGGSGVGEKRPEALKHISIQNNVTPATSVRLAILKILGQRYLASNPGSKFQTIGYDPRPILKLTPPSSASDGRVQTYNYIEAIKSLPTNFTSAEIEIIAKKVSSKLFGTLRATFTVINDDMIRKKTGQSGTSGGSGRGSKRGNSSPASGSSGKQKK